MIKDWSEVKDFITSPEEDVMHAEEAYCIINYQEMGSNMPCSLLVLSYCEKASELEGCSV